MQFSIKARITDGILPALFTRVLFSLFITVGIGELAQERNYTDKRNARCYVEFPFVQAFETIGATSL